MNSTLNRHPHRSMQGSPGFTLMEVLVTAAVLGVAFISGTWAMSSASSGKTILEADAIDASLLAREIHALATTLPKAPSGSVGATTAGGVLALDSLEGAVFSPPLKGDGSTDGEHPGWTQTVDLAVFDLSDLSTPTADDPTAGLPEDGPLVYRLTVDVSEGGTTMGTHSWWLSP
jgi:prepilin-type N-terminal cleavage/methylation domain-containing protein